MFKETVILAERAAEAGLTQDARFPMMKNQSKSDHHGDTEARRHGGTQTYNFKRSCSGSVPPW